MLGKGNAVTSLEKAINVERTYRIEPAIPVGKLKAALGPRHEFLAESDGPLAKANGDRVINALRQASGTLAPQIDALCATLDAVVPSGRLGEMLGQQKDATGVLLEIGGFRRGILRSWLPQQSVRLPFLQGIPERAAYEDQILAHDAVRFPDWLSACSLTSPVELGDLSET